MFGSFDTPFKGFISFRKFLRFELLPVFYFFSCPSSCFAASSIECLLCHVCANHETLPQGLSDKILDKTPIEAMKSKAIETI